MAKLWEGRFSKALDSAAESFNSSIDFDCRMWKEDITMRKCSWLRKSSSQKTPSP